LDFHDGFIYGSCYPDKNKCQFDVLLSLVDYGSM